MNNTFQTQVGSCKVRNRQCQKKQTIHSLGSLLIKHKVWGEGKEGKRAVSTNVCNFIQIYSRCKLGIFRRKRKRKRRKGKERKSARDF